MMDNIKTSGIVIKAKKYKESSKILTVFTYELGKINILAQGVLKPNSNALAYSEIFSTSDFILKKGRNFYYIVGADLINSNYSLRESIESMAIGFYLIDLVDKAIPEEEKNDKIYNMLTKALEIIQKGSITNIDLILAFELKLISFVGYKPDLTSCIECQTLKSTQWYFDIEKGGILCSKCKNKSSIKIEKKFIRQMIEYINLPFDNINSEIIIYQDKLIMQETLYKYILDKLDIKDLKSWSLARELLENSLA